MQAMIDWERERRTFPAANGQVYLNSAASGPLCAESYEATRAFMDRLYLHGERGDSDFEKVLIQIEEARRDLSDLIEARGPEEIGFAPSTSMGMNLAASLLKQKGRGNEILMPEEEFPSSALPFYHYGFQIRFVPVADFLKEVETVSQGPAAVLVSAVQYSNGYRLPLEEIGDRLERMGVPFFVNATHALGVSDLSVRRAKVSLLTASCHKWMMAGYGTSVFYADSRFREGCQWPWMGWLSVKHPEEMSNRPQELRADCAAIEAGVPPIVTLLGIGASLRRVKRLGVENIQSRILGQAEKLIAVLTDTSSDVEILSPSPPHSGIVSFRIRGRDVEALVRYLESKKIYLTCRRGAVRASVNYFNDESDFKILREEIESYLNRS